MGTHILNLNKKTLYLFTLLLGTAMAFLFIGYAFATNETLPTSDGNYTQWTPSTGTSHFALVDESPCNGTTDYNSTNTVGNRDSYGVNISSVPNAATITSIKIIPCASRNTSGGGNPTMNVFYRFNGVNSSDAGSYSLTGTTPVDLATTTFSGLSLQKSSTSTLEEGVVLTTGAKGARVSRLALVYSYTSLLAPTHLTATSSATTTSIRLKWGDNATTETGYQIQRSTSASGPWTGIATTTANVSTYVNSGLAQGTTYYYRVRAFNHGGYSSFTNIASDTAVTLPPNKPFNLTASLSPTTTPEVDLNWVDNSSNENGFEIQRSFNKAFWENVATTSPNVSFYGDVSVSPATEYYYRVRAFNLVGYSAFSNTVSATTTP